MNNENPFDVVIPYIPDAGNFEALRYALRSIENNLSVDNVRVVIVGDMPKFVNPEMVKHIPLGRVDNADFTNCLDATRKMNAVILDEDTSADFLVMYDDTYIVKETSVEDLAVGLKLKKTDLDLKKVHAQLLKKTYDALEAKKLPIENIETHTPRLVNKAAMIETFKAFWPIKNRLLHFTLYYNHHAKTSEFKTISKQNKHKIGFYGYSDPWSYASDKPAKELVEKIQKYRFLNHNDDGLSESLQEAIKTIFPEKSKYEL